MRSILLIIAITGLFATALAGEEEELDEELSTLEEDDFPDLVAADESGGIMDELDFLQDAGMVELAARHVQEIGMSPSAIWVLTREDIDTTGAMTVADLLRQVPGLEIVNLSPMFTSVTGRVLWNYENNTHQVLVDGRRANVETLGFAPWFFLPIFLHDIERIEVIRGPGSALYGANALAGVISITTRTSEGKTGARTFVEGGEAGLFLVGARGSVQLGDWGVSAGLGIDLMNRWKSDPWTPGRNPFKARLAAEYRWSEGEKLVIDAGASGGTGVLPTATGNIDAEFFLATLLLAYRSENLRGRLDWNMSVADGRIDTPLIFNGVHVADFIGANILGNTLDGEVQWTVPIDWEPLLLIVGGGVRTTWISSPNLLDEKTFSDIGSDKYHEAGLDYWEIRTGAFAHAELTPVDWMTLTAGLRFDYNTETQEAISPRLATVFKPAEGQFVRLGVARSFRKPTMWEKRLHVEVSFPEGGPFVGDSQDSFREFMTRVVGNPDLENETLLGVEIGYLGQFLDGSLSLGLDLYYNLYQDETEVVANIVPHPQYLINLDESSFMFENFERDLEIIGLELTARYQLSRSISLLAAWVHREVYDEETGRQDDRNPKNTLTLGGHFLSDLGLLGSLYIQTRSEFWDRNVDNPKGIMEPHLIQHQDNIMLVSARAGYRWETESGARMEAGVKMFLPVSFTEPHFQLRERGGGVTPFGVKYGADELTRIISVYCKGSF